MASDRPPLTPERLEEAAKSLRPIERQVLLLSARDGLSSRQLAALVGITPEAAERRLAIALRKLDRALERRERPWWRFW